jgi:hypothetical protein
VFHDGCLSKKKIASGAEPTFELSANVPTTKSWSKNATLLLDQCIQYTVKLILDNYPLKVSRTLMILGVKNSP